MCAAEYRFRRVRKRLCDQRMTGFIGMNAVRTHKIRIIVFVKE